MPKTLDNQQEAVADKRIGFDSNCYWRLSQEDNETLVITPAVDLARTLNSITHYDNGATGPKYRWCSQKTYGKECDDCANKNKDISRQNQKRSILVFNHSAVGKKKKSKDGTKEYEANPLQIMTIGVGEGGSLMAQLKDLNGDLKAYYKIKDGESLSEMAPDPELLKGNEFLFNQDTGKDQLFGFTKTVSGEGNKKKVSYTLTPMSHTQAQKKLGTDKQVKVPDDVRAKLDKLTLTDLAPHYIASNNFGNTDWAEWELEPPAKGSRIGDPVEEETDKDSAKAKL